MRRETPPGIYRRLSSASIALIVAWAAQGGGAAAQVVGRIQQAREARAAFPHLRKPENPEAVGLFLNLLARYAADVPDKSDLDQQIALALNKIPDSRETAQRMVDNFRSVPLELRQAAFGPLAEPSTQLFERQRYDAAFSSMVAAPLSPFEGKLGQPRMTTPMMLRPGAPITIRFKGFKCFGETGDIREGSSDEIYIIAGVPIMGAVKLPVGEDNVFEGIDAGDMQVGPVTPIVTLAPQPMTMVVTVINQNFSKPSEVRKGIDLVIKTAESAWETGPYTVLAAKIVGAIVSWAFPKDRVIGVVPISFDAARLETMAATAPGDYYGILRHFDTYHTDGDASYAVYFDVFREDAPSDLQVEDISSWSGDLYAGRARLTWQPAQDLHHLTIHVDRHRVGRPMVSWEEMVPADASSYEMAGQALEQLDFVLTAFSPLGKQVGEPLKAQFQIPLPGPKAPSRPLASWFGTDTLRLVWTGDNVTESYEIERLQWPAGTDRSDRQSVGTLDGSRNPAKPSGGITGLPPIRGAPATIPGGESPSGNKKLPPNWVPVLKQAKVGSDTREQIALHRIIPISVAVGGSIYQPYTYRVCAVNAIGRACSEAVQLDPH